MTSFRSLHKLLGSKNSPGIQHSQTTRVKKPAQATREKKLAQLRGAIDNLRNHVNDIEKQGAGLDSVGLSGTEVYDKLAGLVDAGDRKSLKDGKKVASRLGTRYIAQACQLWDSFDNRMQPNSPEHQEMMRWRRFHTTARDIEKRLSMLAKMKD